MVGMEWGLDWTVDWNSWLVDYNQYGQTNSSLDAPEGTHYFSTVEWNSAFLLMQMFTGFFFPRIISPWKPGVLQPLISKGFQHLCVPPCKQHSASVQTPFGLLHSCVLQSYQLLRLHAGTSLHIPAKKKPPCVCMCIHVTTLGTIYLLLNPSITNCKKKMFYFYRMQILW